jgi:hypothetical protein
VLGRGKLPSSMTASQASSAAAAFASRYPRFDVAQHSGGEHRESSAAGQFAGAYSRSLFIRSNSSGLISPRA